MSDLFHPFGTGVRIGGHGAPGNVEIAANLSDFCCVHGVKPEQCRLDYPEGSVMILNPNSEGLGSDVYLAEPAYNKFMEMIEGGRA